MTQQELASKLGVAQGYISLLERGQRKPSLETLERICLHIKIPLPLLSLRAAEQSDLHGIPQQQAELLSHYLMDFLGSDESDGMH